MFYDEGLHFSCTRCSGCCRLSPGFVYLSRSDLTNLCLWFRIPQDEFIGVYCRWVQYYDGTEVLCLKEKTNYDCILWEDGTGCGAYERRPVQCSTYPFWSWMLESRETWDKCARDCPGMNTGTLWARGQIEAARRAYDANEPVHRNELYGVEQ